MRQPRTWATVITVLILGAGSAIGFGASQTWTGYVSDSQCGADHGGEVDPHDCTLKCIQAGDKYVLVTDSGTKITPIANQEFPGLADYAGREAKVTGELKDGAIVMSKIEEP